MRAASEVIRLLYLISLLMAALTFLALGQRRRNLGNIWIDYVEDDIKIISSTIWNLR